MVTQNLNYSASDDPSAFPGRTHPPLNNAQITIYLSKLIGLHDAALANDRHLAVNKVPSSHAVTPFQGVSLGSHTLSRPSSTSIRGTCRTQFNSFPLQSNVTAYMAYQLILL